MKKTTTLLFLAGILMLAPAIYAQPIFINEIPIPPLLDAAQDTIRLEMQLLNVHKFNPNDPSNDELNGIGNQGIETWAYNLAGDTTMTVLGPTLKWHTGDSVHIKVTNRLPQPTTTHWHGAEVPAHLDGGPHQPIAPDSTWYVDFRNLDSASTMWYHPHFHNNTYPQVQLGLSGMIISEQASDLIRPVLPHTYGVDDFPIIIGDQQTVLDSAVGNYVVDTNKSRRPINLVNGVTNPYLEVPAHFVRLRILNGSTRKGMQIGVSASYESSQLVDMENFMLIATDGGYTLKPDSLKTLLTGPGARDEIILDLTGYQPGDVLYLRNLKEWMPGYVIGSPATTTGPNPNTGGKDTTMGKAFLQLRVVADPPNYNPVDFFTPFITDWDPAIRDTLNINRHRFKALVKNSGPGFSIDGQAFDMGTINDTICVDTKEIWTIHNQSAVAHPFHIHKIFFRILDIDSAGTFIDLASRGLNGPKDDVLIRPDWKLRFLAAFNGYPNPIDSSLAYMYHCHILTHEDAEGGGMMHQFVVTEAPACFSVGVEDELPVREMVLYPNPASQELFLQGQSRHSSQVRLIDIQGRVLREQELSPFEGNTAIYVKGLPTGFYLVQWEAKEGILTRKVLLQ